MKEIANEDSRSRDYGDSVRFIDVARSGEVVGRVVCYRKDVQLIDFYRTSRELAVDVQKRWDEAHKPTPSV